MQQRSKHSLSIDVAAVRQAWLLSALQEVDKEALSLQK